MRSLQTLDLSISIPRGRISSLSGSLPMAWRNMYNLTTLDLSHTNISGTFVCYPHPFGRASQTLVVMCETGPWDFKS